MFLKRRFTFLQLLLLLVVALLARTATAAQPAGHVDALVYTPTSQQLHIQGWAWDASNGQPASSLRVTVGGQQLVVDALHRVERPDVRAALGMSALHAGFSASLALPTALPEGVHAVEIAAVWPNGTALQLPMSQAGQVRVQADGPPARHWILLALVAGWIVLASTPRLGAWGLRAGGWVAHRPQWVGLALVVLFGLLVAAGVTGSSWPLLAQGAESALVQFQGSQAHVFAPRYIRADEWGILTTNALAQWNHHPPFPVVNTNLGPEGQNMGVIGMTGTPIAQWAAVARPATWGYFFLPLRQAMAWHWQFPFFACLFALWKALGLLQPARPGFNLVLAVTFCVAPYAAGWSLWPLYAAFFPLALFVAFAALTQARHLGSALPWGAAMGVLLAGWVLVLYPPWQVTVGTFVALLALGWTADHRDRLQWRWGQWLGLALALLLAGALLASWWLDTSDAVARMQATVYPGGRTALQGADIRNAPWWALRGYLNTEALTFGLGGNAQALAPSVNVNQSEISSYILLPLPVLLLALWRSTQPLHNRWALRACLVFAAFWLVFRFVGVPLWLAKATLWSHVTAIRLDLAMGLACTALLALVWADAPPSHNPALSERVMRHRLVSTAVALAGVGLVALEFSWMPQGLLLADSALFRGAMVLAVGWGSWWVMRGRLRPAAGLLLLLSLVASLGFNPWSRAPRAVQLTPAVAALASEQGRLQRTLVIGNDAKASVTLVAAGVPVVNAVLYYPHPELWKNMGLTDSDWDEVNRYQHLIFSLEPMPPTEPPFKAHGDMDLVRVSIDPQRFDFASTGAGRVVAATDAAPLLRASPNLRELGGHGGFVWFTVH